MAPWSPLDIFGLIPITILDLAIRLTHSTFSRLLVNVTMALSNLSSWTKLQKTGEAFCETMRGRSEVHRL
ncbi:hypothetical protein L917_13836 [Phytophthora nicotianae]|uniref:Uncharacterized protein n=1 Tax=Phytophthora nicotianae TaxID=4792 RepID=W2KNP7_PHYNI|nr:hypothetical protein L917_13836 [Phytophthora nicotianae]